ncbi:helix-turn-helix domain-containing protein [Flavobacterium sp. UMI-01]|uniref:helix-turn-helix domain-containing protein n=1 Tax=Flavobacterium sp. UMI-01 TaxID=1441053 RepID=UPI001C7DFADA|nr:helix-turn-helix domain-containing protein [Flavobacterium sp. UMI-01]
MENVIPKYNLDFNNKASNYFVIHTHNPYDNKVSSFNHPHSHNYYCLSILYKGKTKHYADFKTKELIGPAVVILNIDQVHIHDNSSDAEMVSLAFTSEFIYGQSKKIGDHVEFIFSQSFLQLSQANLEEIDTYIKLITLEYNKGVNKNLEIIRCLLTVILILCSELTNENQSDSNKKMEIFSKFTKLLKKQYKSYHQVNYYAESLNISTEVLTRVVKRSCNKTPKQLIDEYLLLEAKRLLYWSNITVREVAWELGFETDAYFNRFFKKFTNTTPKEYQKSKQCKWTV